MHLELDDAFASWGGRRFGHLHITLAEQQFGEHFCRLTVRNRTLNRGNTTGCTINVGALFVQNWYTAMEELLGAEAFTRDVDFLVMAHDGAHLYGQFKGLGLPVFTHVALDCSQGLIPLPQYDCVGGAAEHFNYHLLADSSADNVWDLEGWNSDQRLGWASLVRGFTCCTGSVGGSCDCTLNEPAQNLSMLRRFPRYRLAELSHRHPQYVDATGICHSRFCGDFAPAWLAMQEPKQIEWHRYQYLASVDGDSPAETLSKWRPLLLGSVLVRQVHHNLRFAWTQHGLRPYVHYIPVRGDMSDVISRLRWSLNNREETHRIRQAGYDFGHKFVANCRFYSMLYFKAALERYADLQDM